MEYYSEMNENELLIQEATWMHLQEILLSENQTNKLKSYILFDSIYASFLKWQNSGNGEQISGCRELGMGGEGRAKGNRSGHRCDSWIYNLCGTCMELNTHVYK